MKIKYYIGRIFVKLLKLNKRQTYSSLNEDNIIDFFLRYKKEGTYIDIGANNPDVINNTKLFYERGWHGINIEPEINGYKLFCEKRPRDININTAIGSGEIEYFGNEKITTGNTFNKETAEERGLKSLGKIKLKSLKEVFEENNIKYVDFISIDVEHFEDEVLKSNDWNKFRAKILCIEGFNYNYLKKFGYRKIFWDGCNSYYKSIID